MGLTSNDLTVDPYDIDLQALLADWRWLVGPTVSPVVITALGDLFLRDEDGSIHWLDTVTGALTRVDCNAEVFQALMVRPEHLKAWFLPQLVAELRQAGMTLGPGQCYTCKFPPVLGGAIEPWNIEPADLRFHFSLMGQIHWRAAEERKRVEWSWNAKKAPRLMNQVDPKTVRLTREEGIILKIGCMLYIVSLPWTLLILILVILGGPDSYANASAWYRWADLLLGLSFQFHLGVAVLVMLLGGVFLCLRGFWKAFGVTRVTIARLMLAVSVVAVGLALGPIGVFLTLISPVPLTMLALALNGQDY